MVSDPELEEEVPMEFEKTAETAEDESLEDDKVKQLLAGLDDV